MESLNVASLTAFDWFLIAVCAISVISAFRRGIIKVLFWLAGLIAGLLIASWSYLRLSEILQPYIANKIAAEILAFLLILIVVNLVFVLAGTVLKKGVHLVGLGFADRLLGAAFGLLRGCLIGVVVLTTVAAFLPNTPWIRNSRLAPYFLAGTHAVSFVVPASFREQIAEGTTQLLAAPPDLLETRTTERTK